MRFDSRKLVTANQPSGVEVGMFANGADMGMTQAAEPYAFAFDTYVFEQPAEQQADGVVGPGNPGVAVSRGEHGFHAPAQPVDSLYSFRPKDGQASYAGLFPVVVDQYQSLLLPDVTASKLGNLSSIHSAVEAQQYESPGRARGVLQDGPQFTRGEFAFPVLGYMLTPHLSLFCRAGLLEGVSIPRLGTDDAMFPGPAEHGANGLDSIVELPRAQGVGPFESNGCEVTRGKIRNPLVLSHTGQELLDCGVIVGPRTGFDGVHSGLPVGVGDDLQRRIDRHGGDRAIGHAGSTTANHLDQFRPGSLFVWPDDVLSVDSFAYSAIGPGGNVQGELARHGENSCQKSCQKANRSSENISSSDRIRTCDPGLMKPSAVSTGQIRTQDSKENRYSTARGGADSAPKSCQNRGAPVRPPLSFSPEPPSIPSLTAGTQEGGGE